MQCPKCGRENPEGSILCNSCGCSFLDFDYDTEIEVLDTDDLLTPNMSANVNTQVYDNQNITSAYSNQINSLPNSQNSQNFQNSQNYQQGPTLVNASIFGMSNGPVSPNQQVQTPPVQTPVPPTENSSVTNTIPEAMMTEPPTQALNQEVGAVVNNAPVNNAAFNIKDLEQKPIVEQLEETPVEESLDKFQVTGRITLGVLGTIGILLTIMLFTRLNSITLFNKCINNFEKIWGANFFNIILVIILYLLVIFLLAYDSYKTKQSTISKEATKAVILSLILTVISIFVFDGISGLKKTSTYVYALLRFIVLVFVLLGNVQFRNLYLKLEEKIKAKTMLFEFLIYYDIVTLVILIV